MKQYEVFVESEMINFYNLLPENFKRLFSAISSDQLGHGGEKFISKLFKCSPATIIKGKKELDELNDLNKLNEPDKIESLKKNYSFRQRKAGGGHGWSTLKHLKHKSHIISTFFCSSLYLREAIIAKHINANIS